MLWESDDKFTFWEMKTPGGRRTSGDLLKVSWLVWGRFFLLCLFPGRGIASEIQCCFPHCGKSKEKEGN